MPTRSSTLPRDPNSRAHRIVAIATGQVEVEPERKNPSAVALGRLGGAKGGKARAAKLTKQERSEAARKAATARWSRHQD